MPYKGSTRKEIPKYNDIVSFTPETVIFVSTQKMNLIKEHSEIIRALQNRVMTAKEIHHLYYDRESEKHRYTIQTIYRYLEKLQKAGLVTIAGQRLVEGIPMTERLYSRTARIFYPERDESYDQLLESEDTRNFTEKMSILISEFLQIEVAVSDVLYNSSKQFYDVMNRKKSGLLEKTKENERMAEVFSKTELEEINKLITYAGFLITCMQHPEVINELRNLFFSDMKK
ncbi:MAG: hypothetical protein ACFFD4_01690 [Candidatus Odinarchaeota archaeon]